jgi:hypothetical protein
MDVEIFEEPAVIRLDPLALAGRQQLRPVIDETRSAGCGIPAPGDEER